LWSANDGEHLGCGAKYFEKGLRVCLWVKINLLPKTMIVPHFALLQHFYIQAPSLILLCRGLYIPSLLLLLLNPLHQLINLLESPSAPERGIQEWPQVKP